MSAVKPKRYLLLQIRDDAAVCAEEYQCFLQHSGLAAENLDVFNIYKHTDFGIEILDGYAGLLVGGASEANVLQPELYSFIEPAVKLMRHCADIGFPVFASCFGFQLAVLALGGEISNCVQYRETGTVAVDLSKAAATDPLYKAMPDPLIVVSVHQQSATDLPDGCELMASTAACLHSFRVKNKPFWAFQFHPEVNLQTLIERLSRYQEKYTSNSARLDEVLAAAVDTPEANTLLAIFIGYVEQQFS